MVIYFFFGVLLLIGLYLMAQWYVSAKPGQIAGTLKAVAFVLILAVCAFLIFTGRLGLLLFVAPMLLPWLMRARALKNMWKATQGPSPGQSSQVETESLAMELDHESGEMDGWVRSGPFEGRRLSDLDQVLLVDLYRWMAAADPDGARLLEAYLDRTLGVEWREAAGASAAGEGPAATDTTMTREEAYSILGLEPGASADDVRQAYRRLMQHAHPDKGGSPYLAAKINAAKDLLLDESAKP